MKRRRALALLAAALLAAACGGKEAPKAPPKTETAAAPPVSEETGGGGGFDLTSLRGPEEKKPEEKKPEEKKPDQPPPPKPKEAEKEPATEEPKEPAKPAKPVPASPDEISESEVLLSWAADEREALNEMTPADREKEIRKRRLEMFRERGGKIDETSGKMTDAPVEGPDGTRGPARPDAVKEKELPPPALKEILDDLASHDMEVRARGVEAAKRFPEKTIAARHLIPLLEDKDPDLRVIVCSTLGELKQADAVPALAKVVEKGIKEKEPVRAMAIKALGDIGGPQARQVLRSIVRDGDESADRAIALAQLVKQREVGEVQDLLGKALDDLNGDVRQQAVLAIREFNLKAFEKELFKRLEDASEIVIVETMRALGAMGTREAVPLLIKILLNPGEDADDPEELQIAANNALEQITGVRQGLTDTLTDAQKAAAIDSWRVWWKKNKDTWK
jgi:HEAT repeat protein